MKNLLYIVVLLCCCLDGNVAISQDIIEEDIFVQRLDNCNMPPEVCLDIRFIDLRFYEITLDGNIYDTTLSSCNFDTIYTANFDNILSDQIPPYTLNFFEVDGTIYNEIEFNDFQELVDSVSTWDPSSNWQYDSVNNQMFSLNPDPILFSRRIVFEDSRGNRTISVIQPTFEANGTFFYVKEGWSELVFNDTMNNISDTIDIGLYCGDLDTTVINLSSPDLDSLYCFDDIDLLAPIESINTFGLGFSNSQVTLDGECLDIAGRLNGSDSVWYEICDTLGICDSNLIIVNISEIPESTSYTYIDSIYSGQSENYCLPIDSVFAVDTVYNICADSTISNISFAFDDSELCLSYQFIEPGGIDSFCYVVQYDNNLTDTHNIIIYTLQAQSEIIFDSLYVNQSRSYCVSAHELGDSLRSINEFCGEILDGIRVDSFYNDSLCFTVTATESLTIDTICIELCDTSDNCDTTIFIINSLEAEHSRQTVFDTLLIYSSDTLCFEDRLPGEIVEIINLCPEQAQDSAIIFELDTINYCINYFVDDIGADSACILVVDEFGNTDTSELIVTGKTPSIDTLRFDLELDSSLTFCYEDDELILGVDSTYIYCGDINGISPDSSQIDCYVYNSQEEGVDTFCMVYCDSTLVCDTQIVIIETLPATRGMRFDFRDSIFVNQSDTICFEADIELIDSVVVEIDSTTSIDFEFFLDNDFCVSFTSDSIDRTTACYLIRYTNGVVDTLKLDISAQMPATDTTVVDLYVGQDSLLCLDTIELAQGSFDVERFCPDSLTAISIDSFNVLCYRVTAEAAGISDTLCYSICDSFGVCDTIIYVLNVQESFDTSSVTRDTILVNQSDTLCFDGDLPGDLVSISNLCEDSLSNMQFSIDTINFCIIYTSDTISTDTACILIEDEFGNTDTNYVYVNARYPINDTVSLFIDLAQTDTICFDFSELSGNIDDIRSENICPELSGEQTQVELVGDSLCMAYTGLSLGEADTVCIVSCDSFDVCDTTIYILTVVDTISPPGRNLIFEDSVLINFTETICFDTSDVNGAVIDIIDICDDSSQEVDFFVDDNNYCISYTGDSLGVDSSCLVITYDDGAMDTLTFIITVLAPTPDTILLDLFIRDTGIYCFELDELAGAPVDSSFVDICDTSELSQVIALSIDSSTYCIEYEALDIGQDSACLVLCDNFGVCDTTYVFFEVMERNSRDTMIIANNDTVQLIQDNSMFINILNNDIIPDNRLDTIYIITGPTNGNATIGLDGIVEYTPVPSFCGLDEFEYVICQANQCDTALVSITIECVIDEDLFIPEGFSPNGDNIGDLWEIRGLDQFPNTKVNIYNRWGNQVYESNNYQNDWDGTWDGKPLPDGTYFYIIDFRNGDSVQSGYIIILR